MAVKLRLARWGAKKNPYYHIVATDSRSPRDGKFLETVGKYDPLAYGNMEDKVSIKEDRVKYWLSTGAQPTDRVTLLLSKKGIIENKAVTQKTKKNQPKAKAMAKLKELEAAKTAANQAATEEQPTAEETKAE